MLLMASRCLARHTSAAVGAWVHSRQPLPRLWPRQSRSRRMLSKAHAHGQIMGTTLTNARSEAATLLIIGAASSLGGQHGIPPSGVLAFATSSSEAALEPTCRRCRIEDVTGAVAEQLSDVLLSFGAQSVVVEEHRPPGLPEQELFGAESGELWDRCDVIAHFALEHDVACTMNIAGDILEQPSLAFTTELVPNAEWVEQIKASYVPLRISDRLYIIPEWSEPEDPGALNVILQPGVAFGTGEHPTTRLCLEYLVAHEQQLQGTRVLDYGAGSGVLAIAALMMGAQEAVGTDIDPLAVRSAARNAQLNSVADRFTSLQCAPDLDGPDPLDQLEQATHNAASSADRASSDDNNTSNTSTSNSSSSRKTNTNSGSTAEGRCGLQAAADSSSSHKARRAESASSSGAGHSKHQFELVLANILRGPLVELAPRLAAYVCPGGRLVVSGILESQAPEIIAAYKSYGFDGFETSTDGSWALVTGTRSSISSEGLLALAQFNTAVHIT